MKRLKRIMALVIAMAMVLAMAVPVFATGGGTEGSGEGGSDTPAVATAPTSGTITINSPIVGATYNVYKVFDMTTNAAKDAFSYTIDTNSPFYDAVRAYADVKTNGLILTPITTEHKDDNAETTDVDESYDKFNVSVSEKAGDVEGYGAFDAQAFGQAMQAVLAGSEAVEDNPETTDIDESKPAVPPIDPDYTKKATTDPDTSGKLVFTNVDLGYFLINPTYPETTGVTVILDEDHKFTSDDLAVNEETGELVNPPALSQDALAKIDDYVADTVTDAYVNDYIEAHNITTNKNGTPLNEHGKGEYKSDLIASMTADAKQKVLEKLTNTESAHDSDINVKEPILVFLDSSQPDAVINEKNELDKWDVPVNPSGSTTPGTPEHGEPEGGKNIVVKEAVEADPDADPAVEAQPAIYGDWSDAEIGESVHYQLRVNAVNFVQQGNAANIDTQQVKEYIIADYQSAHMHYDTTKGIHVSVWQGDNNNDSQADAGTKNVTSNALLLNNSVDGADPTKAVIFNATEKYLDYSAYADTFFKNDPNSTADGKITDFDQGDHSVFGNGTGIVVPWVLVSEEDLSSTYPVYSVTNIPKTDAQGNPVYKTEKIKKDGDTLVPYKTLSEDGNTWVVNTGLYVSEENHVVSRIGSTENGYVIDTNEDGTLKKDAANNYVYVKDTKPVYTYSIYNSDVTIVVDYWMILDDDAIVDEPGNKNFAQYGWNPIDNKDDKGNPKEPTNPDDDDKPSQKEKVDEATVYTYALAWVKIDEKGNELKDAEFQLPFYVKVDPDTGKPVKDGNAYVFAFALKDAQGKYIEATDATYPEDKSKEPENGVYPKFTKTNTTNLVTTDAAGVITIKGVEQGTYSITETKAPAGFNKLTAPFNVEAKKSGVGVTTKTKTTVYFDTEGNVIDTETETVTSVTKDYNTDADSYNNKNTTAEDEETSVPVYQFDPVVNKQGTELPSTGGIGTTIFYVVGAILVIGAGVILITRRRMDA